MRQIKQSKMVMIGLFSGLMLALSANPAKAADIRIGVGFDLGHHHDYYNRYHHAPVITYRHYDYHDRHYYKKHRKHHKQHWKRYDRHDRHHGKRAYYRDDRHHGKRAHKRDNRRHDRHSNNRHYRH